tara:strand:+ start:338 stop:682 length:345 start_codon:yes stop_codon:yes gene_type:complete
MSTKPLQPIVFNFGLTTAWSTLYTVPPATETIGIDAVVFNNYTTTSQNFSVRLVQAGVPNDLNEVITDSDLRSQSYSLAPAIIGQALVTGGLIQAKASANDSINVNITATITTL